MVNGLMWVVDLTQIRYFFLGICMPILVKRLWNFATKNYKNLITTLGLFYIFMQY
jgi:hypothetical protein